MKKALLVFLIAASLCAFTISAQEVSFSGEFEYGFITDGESFSGKFDKLELDITGTIDEYNTFSMEIEDKTKVNDLSAHDLGITWADVDTNWGALLNLPIGVVTSVGYNGYGYGDTVGVSGWGLEDLGGTWLSSDAAAQLNFVIADMLTIGGAVNFDTFADGATTQAIVGADFAMDTLIASAAYNMEAEEFYVEAQYGLTDLGLSFAAGLSSADYLKYGVGAGYTIAGATLGVSFGSSSDNTDVADDYTNLDVYAGYAITDTLCADVGAVFNLAEDADVFTGFDVSATYTAGAVAYTLGYQNGANYNSETTLADGGVYMACRLDF